MFVMEDSVCAKMAEMNVNKKRTVLDDFLMGELRKTKTEAPKQLRMELSRKIESLKRLRHNRDKHKQRAAQALELLRQSDAAVDSVREDVEKLQKKISGLNDVHLDDD
jgi:hypothetical protein